MRISDITKSGESSAGAMSREKINSTEFSRVFQDASTATERTSSKPAIRKNQGTPGSGKDTFIELGKISKKTPTVSHILKRHPEYSQRCWDIIFASENRNKVFTKMQEGTVVGLNAGTGELVWGRELSRSATGAVSSSQERSGIGQNPGPSDKTILIGTISRERPTVSHIMEANFFTKSRIGKIIHAPTNRDKPFSSLQAGTQVLFNRETMELSFAKASSPERETQKTTSGKPGPYGNDEHIHKGSLADAVKPFIGTPYRNIDCYGLLVRGLMNQGIQYNGHGGLREKLQNLAAGNGLPANAYFTGEGLVKKAGATVYSKSLQNISNARDMTEKIYSEVAPHLREGLILSFSTTTRGHTGVISRQGEEWTYINSGLIDNQISPGRVSKRVGEEVLKEEINNWCVLAAGRKEPLSITIGLLDKSTLGNSVIAKKT